MLRIRAALNRERGMVVNKKLILPIMRELGIKGLPGPKRRMKNLVNMATEEDLVQRNFTVDRPNVLWLTEITEHPTREGKVYCCVVLDAFSRRVVGWAIDRRCETPLVNDALSMASQSRATSTTSVIHSDHGSQFTSWGFSEVVRKYHHLGSMGTIGDCYDNAPTESFWGPMQIELPKRKKWRRRSSCRSPSPSGSSISTTPSACTARLATSLPWSSKPYTQHQQHQSRSNSLTTVVRKMGLKST